ncbi:serine hydrolase [Gramella sp. KN1008]|uniref:serine hydrolase domain-containing protein n=1 Tax=Gramella sp. KN1008 TaxID=2529298 RepID=UPI00103E5077|nr:serine hydrolase domain-containing protein [Gramella sp. KN1008]TBW30011.1 class A beta-lactamase-related serine hydrolase [Gramella sp. KN1008]
MKNLNSLFYLFSLICLGLFCSCQQRLETESDTGLTTKIDSIFQKWNNDSTPGVAVAVVKNGEVIFKKGYGMANLEYDIPIQTNTIFHIASESKQFTNYCIALLAERGKLSLEDDIRKHLPYVPDFGKKITIKNLIYHTSGLRDQWQLLAISGTRIDDVIKQDHIIKLVENQKRLNFDPGERHLYCNTGYTLLAEIVEKVSGNTLREFAEQEIFKPLDMNNTHFHDNYEEIVKNRAYSYNSIDSTSFKKSILSYSTVGATSLFTTVEDEAKWLNNLNTGKVGGMEVVNQMHELGVLNSGDTLTYAFGLSIERYKGRKMIGHGGSDAGFRSFVVRFPEEDLGIIVFSNLADISAYGKAMEIADIFLPEEKQENNAKEYEQSLSKKKIGNYYSDQGLTCELIDSTDLFLKFNWGAEQLIPLSESTFSIFNGNGKVKFSSDDHNSFEFYSFDEKQLLKKYTPIDSTAIDNEEYVGSFKNDELDSEYKIKSNGDHLILQHKKYEDVKLEPITINQFTSPHWWMQNIIFDRNEEGKIVGFEINSGRVLHLYFKKTIK